MEKGTRAERPAGTTDRTRVRQRTTVYGRTCDTNSDDARMNADRGLMGSARCTAKAWYGRGSACGPRLAGGR